jgi:hypothetical protein
MEVNAEIHKRNGDEKTSHAAVTAIRLDDYRETANILGAELSRVLAEQRRLQELALSE